MVWKYVKGPGARIFWGYIAAVMLIAMLSPGMAVFAEEGASAPEVAAADEASPPAEEAVVEEAPPEPEPVETPIVAPPAEESVVAEPAKPEPVAVAAEAPASVVPLVADDDPSDLGVVPVLTEGNPPLCDGGIRVDDGESGSYEIPGHPGMYVTVASEVTEDGPIFSFESDVPVIRVVAKGGNVGANSYPYEDYPELQPVYADGNLHSPVNPSGKYAGLSHIDFCFDEEPIPTDIRSRKWYDANKDGNWWLPTGGMDPDEYFIPEWRVELWEKDGTEPLRVVYTDAGGWYLFEAVPPGEYVIKEEIPEGWEQTHPLLRYGRDYWPVTLVGDGRVLECETPFGNVREEPPELGCIKVLKFEDLNEDGEYDDEPMLQGWEFKLYDDQGALVGSGETNADGELEFCELPLGEYTIVETLVSGWTCTTHTDPTGKAVVMVVAGETREVRFGNYEEEVPPELGSIIVYKYEDANGNAQYDEGEKMLEDWEFSLDYAEQADVAALDIDSGLTDEYGELTFDELRPGLYMVTETLKEGWINTTGLTAMAEVVAGKETPLWFGNQRKEGPPDPGSIKVFKFYDTDGDGLQDAVETGLAGWAFTLKDGNGAVVASGTTNAAGLLVFGDLEPGSYTVTETLKAGWENTTGLAKVVVVVSGQQTGVMFGNRETEEEDFLPFTGGEYMMLLSVALAAAVLGLLLRLRSDRAA